MWWIIAIIIFILIAAFMLLLVMGSDQRKWDSAYKEKMDDEQEKILSDIKRKTDNT